MSIDALKSQNISQYITLLSNPEFLKAVKSAASEGDDGGKYKDLLENLEKLSNLLSESNASNVVPETSDQGFISVGPTAATKEDEDFWKLNRKLGQLVDQLITNADLLEDALNLDVTPPTDLEINLFTKFIEIIHELDVEVKKLEKKEKEHQVKCEYKLRPSATSKTGFEEGLTFVAQ